MLMLLMLFAGRSRAFLLPVLRPQRRHATPVTFAFAVAQRNAGNDDEQKNQKQQPSIERIRIVGGGLAGLSLTYNLLRQTRQKASSSVPSPLHIEVFDTNEVGMGGASPVAGGLMHPLSPRGKLVHWGLEGLASTNRLITAATRAPASITTAENGTIVLRNELFRIAETEEHVQQLQQTATAIPDLATWKSAEDIARLTGCNSTMGGLQLSNGCCVLHVPSYLQGLWKACQDLADQSPHSSVIWKLVDGNDDHNRLSSDLQTSRAFGDEGFDTTVYCAGAGMFTSLQDKTHANSVVLTMGRDDATPFPVQLVRGQSLELQLETPLLAAVLCGKYISPMPINSRPDACLFGALVGATHEFQAAPLSVSDVVHELQQRTTAISSFDWTKVNVERVTRGYRVQSTRGKYGRRPIIGRLLGDSRHDPDVHGSRWIFSGLGSRGLLYHGLYGEMLASAILAHNEATLLEHCPDMLWWKK